MVTQHRIRKSAKMAYLEVIHTMDIKALLLDKLTKAHGSYTEASESLNITISTFSRWLNQLGLDDEAHVIRQANGLPNTDNNLAPIVSGGVDTLRVGQAVSGDCTSCAIGFLALEQPVVMVNVLSEEGKFYMEVRDSKRKSHWYELKTEKLQELRSEI